MSRYANSSLISLHTDIFDRGPSEASAEASTEPEAPKEEVVGWDSQTFKVESYKFLTEGEESRKEGRQADCCEG